MSSFVNMATTTGTTDTTSPNPVVTPPSSGKKTKSKQNVIDVDKTELPQTLRKRRASQSTELPISKTTDKAPKTNKNLFPSTAPTSDIATIANEILPELNDSKMPAISTPNNNTTIPPTTATKPPPTTIPTIAMEPTAVSPPKIKLVHSYSKSTKPPTKTKKYGVTAPLLRAIVVGDSTTRTTVVFRTENRDFPGRGCWCDKRLEDENIPDNGWCRKLGMVPSWNKKHNMKNKHLEYAIDNVKVRVAGGFTTRLFTVIINEPYNLSKIISTARILCDTLIDTYITRDFNLIALEPDKLMWSTEPAVWADFTEMNQTYQLLLHNTGLKFPDEPTQGYFEAKKDIIFEHFKNGSFSVDLKNDMFAPDSVLHESLLPSITSDNASEPIPTTNESIETSVDSAANTTPISST